MPEYLSFPVVAITGLLGFLIGSFLNVVVWRLPRGESLSHPGSACPRCGHPIRWFDNVPVLSWLLLRGRCRDCAAVISPRYPLVELATGAFFAGVTVWLLGPVAPDALAESPAATLVALAGFLYLAAITVALTLIDLDTHTLPNKIVFPAYIVGVIVLTIASALSGD